MPVNQKNNYLSLNAVLKICAKRTVHIPHIVVDVLGQ